MAEQKRIVLLGPPGAGKGTQAKFIAGRFAVPHISTGDMMRAAMAAGGALGDQVRAYVDSGRLVPDALIIAVVRERLQQPDCRRGFLLDGFPRTLDQAEALDRLLDELNQRLTHVVDLRVPEAVLKERLLKRAAEQGRADDTEEVILERMRVFERQTRPVADYYARGGRLRVVDGVGAIDEIQERLSRTLEGQ